MGVFTFVCRSSGEEWSGKQLKGELEASAPSTFDLQRKLVQLASSTDSPAAGVQSSFSFVTPTSAVFQVIIGGGGAASAAAPEAPPAAAEAAPAEEKKEEIEESDGEDYNFSLFD